MGFRFFVFLDSLDVGFMPIDDEESCKEDRDACLEGQMEKKGRTIIETAIEGSDIRQNCQIKNRRDKGEKEDEGNCQDGTDGDALGDLEENEEEKKTDDKENR